MTYGAPMPNLFGFWCWHVVSSGLFPSCTRSFLNRKSGMADGLVTFTFIVSLSMLMLIVFELLFEARARYFYSSVTLFIFFAVFGMRWMLSRARAWRASH